MDGDFVFMSITVTGRGRGWDDVGTASVVLEGFLGTGGCFYVFGARLFGLEAEAGQAEDDRDDHNVDVRYCGIRVRDIP